MQRFGRHAWAFAILVAGCSRMPDASDAQEGYAAHRSTVDDVATKLREAIHSLPQVSVVRCEDARDVVRADDPRRNAEFEACSARRRLWLESANASWVAFRSNRQTEMLLSHHDIVGLSVSLTVRGETTRATSTIGASGPSVVGVAAASGFSPSGDDEGRRVGYHLYQTAVESGRLRAGDGEQRPAIEVTWSITDGDARADVVLVVLLEDETTDEWRRVQRQLAVRD